jgi:hypothetical protein
MKRLKSPKKTNPMGKSEGDLATLAKNHSSNRVSPNSKLYKVAEVRNTGEARISSANNTGSMYNTHTASDVQKHTSELPAIG